MTDTTDIAAQEKGLRAACEAAAACGYVHKISVDGRTIEWLFDQLEAERQRADYGQQVIDQRNAECDRLINEIAALKCCISNQGKAVEHWNSWADECDKITILPEKPTTVPQKSVVLPDKIPDALYKLLFDECGGFVECELDTNKVWQAFKAAIEAAGGVVKDGE